MSGALLWVLCLLTLIAVFVPFLPYMPTAGLDGSWMAGMNQAVAQSEVFGRDMIFTFGPYASVYTWTYHPATDHRMLAACLYLAISAWACLFILARKTRWHLPFIYCLILAGAIHSHDAVLFSFQLLVALTIFKTWIEHDDGSAQHRISPLFLIIVLGPFGMLPLVKGSMLILCGAISLLCAACFMLHKRVLAALLCIATPLLSMAAFWLASGQPLGALPEYFISMSQIISGYTEAMMTEAVPREVLFFVLASLLLLLGIAVQKKIPGREKLFLLALYFLYLFLSFKAGFVRADHKLLSGEAILVAGAFLPFVMRNKAACAFVLIACCEWLYLVPLDATSTLMDIPGNLEVTYMDAIEGIKGRVGGGTTLETRFESSFALLRKSIAFPSLSGSADIYPSAQTYLFAAGYQWQPRPILQSYSAYTPYLSDANRQHLVGMNAPENIVFTVSSLDRRIPSIDDGASWPLLLTQYHLETTWRNYLFLKRNSTSGDEGLTPMGAQRHKLGETFSLINSKEPLFVQIEVTPTLLGRFAAIFYKPMQLQTELELADGTKRRFSTVSGMMRSGFLLSPLVENNDEFAALYGENRIAGNNTVKSLTIVSADKGTAFWKADYTIHFSSIRGKTSALLTGSHTQLAPVASASKN